MDVLPQAPISSCLNVSDTVHITFIEVSNTYVAPLVMLDIGIVKILSHFAWHPAGSHLRPSERACSASDQRS